MCGEIAALNRSDYGICESGAYPALPAVRVIRPVRFGKNHDGLADGERNRRKMKVPIAVIDTEARSVSKYADRYSFIVDNLQGKTIDHYLASMNAAKEAGYKVLVIDSLSHAWRELTEEVDRIAQNSTSKNTFSPWAKVSPKQKRFIDAILNYPGYIIVTMRSKTEWIIGEGKNGKTAPEKMGLAPEQGKGIEYEFDLLVELTQRHEAVVTKDRTGKFQDETIEKPGEEFGIALYDWLASGKPEAPTAPAPEGKASAKPSKAATASAKPKPEKPAAAPTGTTLKEQGDVVIKEIGEVITASFDEGTPCFTEDEKEEARQIIRETRLDEKGIEDLKEFKAFLSDERAKREAKKQQAA
jgi:hypothetical protein